MLHTCPLGQVPQLSVPPQPSGTEPQPKPCEAQVIGLQPHTPTVPPPPQMFGAVQVPQSIVPQQLSEKTPQLYPCAEHVSGLQLPDGRTAYQPSPSWSGGVKTSPLAMATPRLAKCPTVVSVLVMVKFSDVFPSGIVTANGTVTQARLLVIFAVPPPLGADWKLVAVPVALLAPSTTDGLSLIGYGEPVPHTSLNEKATAGWVSQPEARHSWLKVHVPAVPMFGPAKQVYKMPLSPCVAGKEPPHTVPCRSAVSFGMSAGGFCAVTVSTADCV